MYIKTLSDTKGQKITIEIVNYTKITYKYIHFQNKLKISKGILRLKLIRKMMSMKDSRGYHNSDIYYDISRNSMLPFSFKK